MRHSHLPSVRQQVWAILHYPFHLALVLFMQGFTQFIIWGKVMNVFRELTKSWANPDENTGGGVSDLYNTTSSDIAASLTNETNRFFELYPPKYYDTWDAAKDAIKNISQIDNGLWPLVAQYDETGDDSIFNETMQNAILRFGEQNTVIFSSLANGLFNAFGIDLITEQTQKYPNETNTVRSSKFQVEVSDKTQSRYRLVVRFLPLLLCGGPPLLLLIFALL